MLCNIKWKLKISQIKLNQLIKAFSFALFHSGVFQELLSGFMGPREKSYGFYKSPTQTW